MKAATKETQWIKAPWGVYELRHGRRAILHTDRGQTSDDYSKVELRCYANCGEKGWRYINGANYKRHIPKTCPRCGDIYERAKHGNKPKTCPFCKRKCCMSCTHNNGTCCCGDAEE